MSEQSQGWWKIEAFLAIANLCFEEIRGDWTDPRQDCKKGQNAIHQALELIEQLKE